MRKKENKEREGGNLLQASASMSFKQDYVRPARGALVAIIARGEIIIRG